MTGSPPKTLLVSGGSRGIGAAIVRGAAAQGWSVCFSFVRDERAASALVEEITAKGGYAHAIQGDVANPDFAPRFFDLGEASIGAIGALVNNAGITGQHGAFVDLAPDAMRRTIDVNLMGTLYLAQEAVRRWTASGTPGRMVNMSSVAATLGSPGEYVHYAASKAAIEALTIGLGREVAASSIRINALAPGTVYTEIHAAGGVPDRPQRVVGRVPMQRIAEPHEIADVALWLLSDAASYVTATVVRASGGL